jgi:hypothetical protein
MPQRRRLMTMATITQKEIIEEIIANNGRYMDDPLVVKIVSYSNMFNGGEAWGIIYEHEDPMRYHKSPACHNPQTIWVHKSLMEDHDGRGQHA